ncbi:MAG: hypothetical protein AAGC95_11355 [Pseudomonadota bacterium]
MPFSAKSALTAFIFIALAPGAALAETSKEAVDARLFAGFMETDYTLRQSFMTDAFLPVNATFTLTGALDREAGPADLAEARLGRRGADAARIDFGPNRPTFGVSYAF